MKKYILIKEYPTSPKLGTVITIGNDGYLTWKDTLTNGYISIHNSGLSEYKEFWKEVVEKDYEILSFICVKEVSFDVGYGCINPDIIPENSILHKKDAFSYNNVVFKESDLLNSKNFKIHSVRRLSDGEIFTIGDNTTIGFIVRFYIEDEKLFYATSPARNGYCVSIAKKEELIPLFTSEDGYTIYEKEAAISVNIETLELNNRRGFYHNRFVPNPKFKYFKCLKNAQEYVLLNSKTLSINDVMEFTKSKTLRDKLLNFLKNK